MKLIKDRFVNRLEDTIYDVLFPKEKRKEYEDDRLYYEIHAHAVQKLTDKLKTSVLELIPEKILIEIDKE